MSVAEEHFVEARSSMTSAIGVFYKACQAIEIDNEGFVEDVVGAVFEATDTELEGEGVVVSDYI